MPWPDYIGLDPEPARSLARTASEWSGSVDAALRDIQAAETLTGDPVGVTPSLDDVASASQIISIEIDRAIDTVESYQVPSIGIYWQNDLASGSVDQAYRQTQPSSAEAWTAEQDGMVPLTSADPRWQAAAQDGLVPGGPSAQVELPVLDMSQATDAITRLAAEVDRLNGSFEAGVETDRRVEAFAELHALGRTVAVDEAADLGVNAGTWVHRDVAATAIEWGVAYDEGALLHRRGQIMAEEPTIDYHLELLAIAATLTALHQGRGRDDRDASPDIASVRLSPGVFDGFVASRPESLDDPPSLSDEALVITIENWDVALPSAEAQATLLALVAERDARARAPGITEVADDNRRAVLTSIYTRQVLGLVPQLAADDVDDNRLVEQLLAEGYPSPIALQVAALLRTQFPGNEVAAHRGIAAAIAADAEVLGTDMNQLPSAADFEAFVVHAGREAVDELQLQYLDAVLSAVDTYTLIAGEEPSAELLVALTDYAIDNGLTVSQVARDFLGLRPSNPPFGNTATELTQPEVVEIRAIIDQHQAEYDAMTGHASPTELLGDAGWLFQRHRPNGDPSADAYSAATSADLDGLFVESPAIEHLIAGLLGPPPTLEQIEASREFIDNLKLVQYAAHLQGTDYFDPLDADQIAVLDRVQHYWSELQQLFNPPPSTYADASDPFEARQSDFLPRVSIDKIEQLLAANEGSPGLLLSPGLASALRELLNDPDLVAALTPRESDLHAPARHIDALDFHRLDNAAIEDLLATITRPWAEEVDAIKPGQSVDGRRMRTDWRAWIAAAESDPAVPLLVIDAANAVVEAGLYDTSALDASHVVLAVLAALPIPILREVAALLDAGLYYAVDQDPAYGTLALSGVMLPGIAGFTRWRLSNADELTKLINAADSADELVTTLQSVDQTQNLATAVTGLNVTDEVGRGLDQLHVVDDLANIVGDLDHYDELAGFASAVDDVQPVVSASSIATAVHGATPSFNDPTVGRPDSTNGDE